MFQYNQINERPAMRNNFVRTLEHLNKFSGLSAPKSKVFIYTFIIYDSAMELKAFITKICAMILNTANARC